MDHSQIQSICLAEVRFFLLFPLTPFFPQKKCLMLAVIPTPKRMFGSCDTLVWVSSGQFLAYPNWRCLNYAQFLSIPDVLGGSSQ